MVPSRALVIGILTALAVLLPATHGRADDDNFWQDFADRFNQEWHRQNMEELERQRLYNEQLRLYYEQQRFYQQYRQQQRPVRCWTQFNGGTAQTICR